MKYFTNVLFLSLLIYKSIQGFNIRNFSNLQTIISTRAIMSTIMDRFNSEVIKENFMSDIIHTNTQHINIDVFYLFVIANSIMYNTNYNKNILQKLEKIEDFYTIQMRTKKCLLILAIVFSRNIENAI